MSSALWEDRQEWRSRISTGMVSFGVRDVSWITNELILSWYFLQNRRLVSWTQCFSDTDRVNVWTSVRSRLLTISIPVARVQNFFLAQNTLLDRPHPDFFLWRLGVHHVYWWSWCPRYVYDLVHGFQSSVDDWWCIILSEESYLETQVRHLWFLERNWLKFWS